MEFIMRKLFIAAAATAAIAAVSGSAFAAGLNGVYVGAALGGSGGNAATVLSAIPGTYNMGGNGITGGGFVGWGTTLGGNVYYGIEGAFDTSTLAAKDPSARV
jgi:hypothetical protein